MTHHQVHFLTRSLKFWDTMVQFQGLKVPEAHQGRNAKTLCCEHANQVERARVVLLQLLQVGCILVASLAGPSEGSRVLTSRM